MTEEEARPKSNPPRKVKATGWAVVLGGIVYSGYGSRAAAEESPSARLGGGRVVDLAGKYEEP